MAKATDMEFVLVEKSEVGKPEFGGRNVDARDTVEITFVPSQPIIRPFLHNMHAIICASFYSISIQVLKGPIGYKGTPQIHPKTVPSLRRLPSPSNTPIPRPTPLTIPNGIRIQSAVLPQLAFADRQMGQANLLYH